MTKATDGVHIYAYNHVLTGDTECFAHEGGLFVLYSHDKDQSVTIDPIGMTEGEIERAMVVGDTVLARAERAPVNRAERRAAERRVMN